MPAYPADVAMPPALLSLGGIVIIMLACVAAVAGGPTYTVSQELGIDGLGYVLQQDAAIRGAGTTITVRLDRLAIPSSRVQFVRFERCVFYDASALVFQGPNQAASDSVSNGDVALSLVVQDCTFNQGSAVMLLGALRASVVVLERCTFTGDLYAPASALFARLSTYAQVQHIGPRIVLSSVTLQDKSIIKVVETTFATPTCGVAILVDSTTPTSGYGLELQSNSALVVERCHATLTSSNIAALWFTTAAVAMDTSSELQFSACRVTVQGGATTTGISLSPPASIGATEPIVNGFLLLHGNTILIASTTGVVTAFDLDAVAATTSSIVMFTTNTAASSVVGSSDATCVVETSAKSGLLRFPRSTSLGVMSLVENVVSDAAFSGCTNLVVMENSAAAYDVPTSKLYVQCNDYNAVQPWTGYLPPAAVYTLFEGTCGNACFEGFCASFIMTASAVPCACQCIGADQYGNMCGPVDVAALLYAFRTTTRTATRALTPSIQEPTHTHTVNMTISRNVNGRASRSQSVASSQSASESTTPTRPKMTVSIPIKTRSESATLATSATPSVSYGGASRSMSQTDALTQTVRTQSASASATAGQHSLSTSPSKSRPSPSATASMSQDHRSKSQTNSLSVPSPSSDTTITETDTATTTSTKTVTHVPTNTTTWVVTVTPTASTSQQLTSSVSHPVGCGRQQCNGTADTLTTTITWTVSASRSQNTQSLTDARSHILAITETHSISRSPPTATPSTSPLASQSGGTLSDSGPSPSMSGTGELTSTTTVTLSADVASVSATATSGASHSIETFTETMAVSKTVSTSGMPTLTATVSAGFRSNTTSASAASSSSISPSSTPTESVSPSRTQSNTWGSVSVLRSQSASVTGTSDPSTSTSQNPTASVSLSVEAPTQSASRSLSASLSQELATMTDTRKPLKSRTSSLSKDPPTASMSVSDSGDGSHSKTLAATPSHTCSSSSSSSREPSTSLSSSKTITYTRTVSISEALASATETRTQTQSKSLASRSRSYSAEGTTTATQSVSVTVGISTSDTASATDSNVFSGSVSQTSTTTVTTECSSSVSNDRRASASETGTVSFTISATHTRNRRDGNASLSMTSTASRVLLSDTDSASASAFPSRTLSPSRSQSPTQSQGTPTVSPSPHLTASIGSNSLSLTVSPTVGSPTQASTPSVSTSPSLAAASKTPTASETQTATLSITIRRSFSRAVSRSRSISEERTETHSVQPTFTRTFHYPSSNFASANLFAEFQRRASTCVQLMVYVLVPLAIVFAFHLLWSVYLWVRSTHINTDTYRAVSRTRSLMALHTYLSIFYPCHYKCAVLHSLQCIAYIATWTTVLLCLLDQLGNDNNTMRAVSCMLTLLVCSVFKPLVNVVGFYFWLDDAEDAADDPTGGAGIFSMDATIAGLQSKSQHRRRIGQPPNGQTADEDDDNDGIAFDMDDDEWERYRVDRDMLFRQRLEDDLDIVDDDDDSGGGGGGGGGGDKAREQTDAPNARTRGAPQRGTTPSNGLGDDALQQQPDEHEIKKQEGKNARKRQKLDAASIQQLHDGPSATATSGDKSGNRYGFGELDNFVLFHDDYEAFQHRGHHLRLEQFVDEQEGDRHVASNDPQHGITAGGEEQQRTRRRGNRGDEDAGSRSSGTLTSSCISIQVDDDDNGDGILPTNLTLGAIGVDREDDEVSISDPRTVRTLHVPLVVGLAGLLALELWAIAGHYRNSPLVCTSRVFTLWWITWLIDFLVMEPLYLVLVAFFRYLMREPHEEDVHGNARKQLQDGQTKRDLRWWRGDLLHPYNGETRYR